MHQKLSSGETVSRRTFLRSTIAAAPAVMSANTLASSGQLNLLVWSDLLPETFLAAFFDKTGIVVRQSKIGSNEEIINKMKATQGRGVDLISPTNTRAKQWASLQLLQPYNLNKLSNIDNLHSNLLDAGALDWNFDGRGMCWLPVIWGTEAIAWRNDMWAPPQTQPSYGDLWQKELRGQVMMQPHSGMLGIGLYLERTGQLPPESMRRAYQNETDMRSAWDKVSQFCIANKAQVKLFWNDAQAQKNGLLNEGVVTGQTWDGPVLALKTLGEPISFQAPREGALAWADGFSLSRNANNLAQAYAFLDFCFDAKNAGEAMRVHGYNSAVLGAEQYSGKELIKNFRDTYRHDALDKLWVWPAESQWYAKLRKEYRNRFVNA